MPNNFLFFFFYVVSFHRQEQEQPSADPQGCLRAGGTSIIPILSLESLLRGWLNEALQHQATAPLHFQWSISQ